MTLAEYYLGEPGIILVPIEHLTPIGMSREMATILATRTGWTAARIALFDAAFALYWSRSAALARRTATWPAPRLRHVAVVTAPNAVRPWAQLLNTSAWTLWAWDLDPAVSHPELAAWLLAVGDRMALSGEVATAPVHAAAWWLERTDDECRAFATAAARATRPDADGIRAVAAALPWLRQLRHEVLRPLVVLTPHRPIPGTGLLVPRAIEGEPPALVVRWTAVAEKALDTWRNAWRRSEPEAIGELGDWLADDAPPLLVTAERGRIVWDPDAPRRQGPLRAALRPADAVAVRSIRDDLAVIARLTRAFHAALTDSTALPAVPSSIDQRGYSYLHRDRRLIAYNLHEPGVERLHGPPLPYARAMLGARTAHEWSHLADEAGWVLRTAPDDAWAAAQAAFATLMDICIATAPAAIRRQTAADVAELGRQGTPGTALTAILLTRMPDWRANLIARRLVTAAEGETYVRHNVRTLRPEYPPARLWRMLVRYLYEYQYLRPALGLTRVPDPRAYLWQSTGFANDLVAPGVLDAARFEALADAVATLCDAWALDPRRFTPPPEL